MYKELDCESKKILSVKQPSADSGNGPAWKRNRFINPRENNAESRRFRPDNNIVNIIPDTQYTGGEKIEIIRNIANRYI